MKKLLTLISASLIAVICLSFVTEEEIMNKEQEKIKKITTVEGITEYQLANGLKVLLYPDASSPKVTINITYLVGSRHEGYGESGMAHLLEHMVFKGTPDHPDIPNELQSHGADFNGTTWYDRTNYYETVNATDENLDWALKMEADRMINSTIADTALQKEFSVVRNEFEWGENDPAGILNERVLSAAYLWHNYGKNTIGSKEDIEGVKAKSLRAFYKKYYQPDNAVLMIAGKFDEQKTIELIQKYFGAIPRPERELDDTYTVEPPQDGERFVKLKRVGDVQYISAAYHISSGSHPDYAPLDVLTEVLSSTPSGLLYKALVDSKEASSVGAYAYPLAEPGIAYYYAEVPKDNNLETAQKSFISVLDNVKSTSFSEEDVERAKTKLLKQFDLLFRNTQKVGVLITEFIAMGDWRLAYLYRDAIEKVTPADVERVAKYYFKTSNRTVGIFIPDSDPQRAEVPSKPDIEALTKDYKGRAPVSQGEAFEPTIANIKQRTKYSSLDNGMQLALLSKGTKGNAVFAKLELRFGNEENLKNKKVIASLAGSMLDKGTTSMTREQIKDKIDQLKSVVSIGVGGQELVINIESSKENIVDVLNLIAEVLKVASFPANEFDKLITANLTSIDEDKSQPLRVAQNHFAKQIRPSDKSDYFYRASYEELIEMTKEAKLDDVKAFAKSFFGTQDGLVTLVGDFDETEITKVLSDKFVIKADKPYTRIVEEFKPSVAENITIEMDDKQSAFMFFGSTMNFGRFDEDYPYAFLSDYIFGSGGFKTRLLTRVRHKDGISYGAGFYLQPSFHDERNSTALGYAAYNPDKNEELEKAIKEEFEKALKDGFTEEELKDAQNAYEQEIVVERAKEKSLVSILSQYLSIGKSIDELKKFDDAVLGASKEQIDATFKKYIKLSALTFVKAGDFKKQ